jgi:23S rRNA pseudouridine2605 synthase
MNTKIRINRYLAGAGLGSRRKCERLVLGGSVRVNDIQVTSLSARVDPDEDVVTIDGKWVEYRNDKTLLVLNKPEGVLSSTRDVRGRKTVIDIANEAGFSGRLYPVGRLDIDTTGVILLTDDGELAYRLTHPKYEIPKIYQARVNGTIAKNEEKKLAGGVDIGDYITSPCFVKIVKVTSKYTNVELTIREGKKRQIKRMFSAIGHRVIKLNRKSLGGLQFSDLKIGEIRPLSKKEENFLREKTELILRGNE